MTRFLLVFMLLTAFAPRALAQSCTIGCRCGNACISCAETCHKGTGADAPSLTVVMGVLGGVLVGSLLIVWLAGEAGEDAPIDYTTTPSTGPKWTIAPAGEGLGLSLTSEW